jgi:hypothetical protein
MTGFLEYRSRGAELASRVLQLQSVEELTAVVALIAWKEEEEMISATTKRRAEKKGEPRASL